MTQEAHERPLPRGRHDLSRETVHESQRLRILAAMVEVMAKKGYAATSVADVLRVAGVSRSSFYELFRSKEDCFATAFDVAAARLTDGAAADPGAPDDPRRRFSQLLRRYLDAVAEHPAHARVLLVESLAAGPDVARRRELALRRYAASLQALIGTEPADRFAAEALVSAIGALVTARVRAGDADGVRALHGPLLDVADRLRRQ